jgi:branched-chain amino acid transport system permease protein
VATARESLKAPVTAATPVTLRSRSLGFGVMMAFFVAAPFFIYPVFLMKALCFALFACAFNLLIGYVGLLSFGHAVFLGSAGYVTAHAAKVWGWPPELAILAGTAAAGALGLVIGAIAIRRHGIYFAMITLALAQMIYFFCLQAPFTHGEDGIQAVPRGMMFGLLDLGQPMTMYFVVLGIFLGGFLLIYRTIHSPFGHVLKAIREHEPRAVSLGYKADHYKLIAFVLSAALSGLAGGTKAIVFQLASLTDVHWSMSGEVVLMTLLGGLGTVMGPVVGAFIVITLENYLAQLGAWVTVIQGVIFVACVLTFRRGVVGELERLLSKPLRLNVVVVVEPAEPPKTVKLGMVTSSTGSLALLGLAGIEGARLAIAELNASGGLLGHKLDLTVRDDTGTPEVGARETRDAILNDEVAAVLGPVSSSVLLVMSEVAREHKTILISHTANSERAFVERGHRYIFSVVPNTFIEGSAVARYMAEKPYRRYLIIGPDYELGHMGAEAFERRLREHKPDAEIVGRIWPKLGETDFGPCIDASLKAAPDAIYSNLFGSDLIAFTRQARIHDLFERLPFVGLYDVEVLQGLGKEVPEGVFGYDRGPFHVIRKLAPSQRFEDFIQKYGAATNKYPSTWAINAYDGVMTWARAVRTANSVDTEPVVNAMEGIELDSLRGPGRVIRRVDHQANVGSYLGVVAWDAGFPDFAVWTDATYVPADQVWRPETEVLAIRAQGRGRSPRPVPHESQAPTGEPASRVPPPS